MFDGARDLYQETILQRSRAPRHGRKLDVFDASARDVNALCGDRCEVFVRRSGDGVAEIGFEARGCAISVASADLMAETASGLDRSRIVTLRDAVEMLARTGAQDVPEPLRPLGGLHAYPSRIKCAMLPWSALVAALDGGQESIDV